MRRWNFDDLSPQEARQLLEQVDALLIKCEVLAERYDVEKRKVEAKLAELRQRLNPH